MIALLLAVALVQGGGPSLEATVDEERVSVGEDLLYTLHALSHSPLPMHVTIAPFNGLEIVSRVHIEIPASEANRRYLKTKKDKLGHLLRSV